MHVLITGAAGFIGSSVALRVLERGDTVVGIDNLSEYYDPGLKRVRLKRLSRFPTFRFARMDIADRFALRDLFRRERFDTIVHLAAQVSVVASIANPLVDMAVNYGGTLHVLEYARAMGVKELVAAALEPDGPDARLADLAVLDLGVRHRPARLLGGGRVDLAEVGLEVAVRLDVHRHVDQEGDRLFRVVVGDRVVDV